MTIECWATYVSDIKLAGKLVEQGDTDAVRDVVGGIDVLSLGIYESGAKNRFMIRGTKLEVEQGILQLLLKGA